MKMLDKKKLPKELREEKYFRVADNKKISIDPSSGKWLKGAKPTQLLYTFDELEALNLHENVKHLQFVPGDTGYVIIDFDTDKNLDNVERSVLVDELLKEGGILNQFEGLIEFSASGYGLHVYVKDERLSTLPSDPYKVEIKKGLSLEVFAGDAPIILTREYVDDTVVDDFDKCPKKVYELIEDKLSTNTEEKQDTIKLDIHDAGIAKVLSKAKDNPDAQKNIINGYPAGVDCSTVDTALASIFLKASNNDPLLATAALESWMTENRSKSHCPKTLAEIKNKAKRAIESAYTPRVSTMDELVKKFSMPKAERARLKSEETDMFNGLLFIGQTTSWIAMPNGGKTALAIEAAKHMSKNGYEVFYLYEDAGLGGYSDLADIGDEHDFNVISSNNGGEGSSATTILEAIVNVANSGEDIGRNVYIFDTLKKFTDVLDKSSIKSLFNSLRKINSKGGTVLLLGHAKKYYNEHNKLVYDGMGDILADGDAMYYIYHCGTRDKDKTRYFTVENEKDRAYGTTREISFTLPPSSYGVEFLAEVMDVRKIWFANNYKEDVENAKRIIAEETEITQGNLVNRVLTDSMDLSRKQTKKLLLSLDGIEWFIHKGAKNANIYTINDPSTKKKVPGFIADVQRKTERQTEMSKNTTYLTEY